MAGVGPEHWLDPDLGTATRPTLPGQAPPQKPAPETMTVLAGTCDRVVRPGHSGAHVAAGWAERPTGQVAPRPPPGPSHPAGLKLGTPQGRPRLGKGVPGPRWPRSEQAGEVARKGRGAKVGLGDVSNPALGRVRVSQPRGEAGPGGD